ncbi:MAG: serine hydroxymethyltransferase, partial [Promethearchaeota archaeon]
MGEEIVDKLRETLADHETWRRRCLNLIPSENVTSPLVRRMLASDFGHRYYWDEPWYGGQKFTEQIELLAVEAAKQLFGAKYANLRALSGH